MRVLHPVAAQERFLASGEYRYMCDGQALAVVERWTLHEHGGGALLFRIDEDGREEDGLSILSEALFAPDGTLERYNVHSFNPYDLTLEPFKADYVFFEDYVQIGSQHGAQEREYAEFALVENAIPYIKQTVLMGRTIRSVAASERPAHVFVPAMLSVEENHVHKMRVVEQQSDLIQVGRREIAATCYQIADNVYYWLDEQNIPLRREYIYEEKQYTVMLTNYAYAKT